MKKITLSNIIKRYYTKELEERKDITVFDLFNWKKVTVKIHDFKTNETKFEMKDVEFPEHYSQTACDIIASKYFRRAGVPNTFGHEVSMKEVAHRMVNFWTLSALDEGVLDEEQKDIFYDELVYMLLAQMYAPNSPQWFNTGLYHAYGINKKGEGYFYFDPKKNEVVESETSYLRTAGSACFILKVQDSLLGPKSITDTITTETRLFKYGAGTGSNFSTIRGKGEHLSGGGTSSGLMSFLKINDANAGAIKSGGTTRRAAKIVSLDADHPEIMDFINWKSKEEDKVAALGKMGYSTDFEGEAYATVSGQNSNNSIRVTNSLMKKMLGDDPNEEWELKGRVDKSSNKKINAKDLWNAWNSAAWRCGDPAPQYHDIINEWHTCPNGEGIPEQINASNPCSEYHFLDDTACNLLSFNVARFYDYDTEKFDVEGYVHAVSLGQIVLEATIHWGHYPTPDVARRSYLFRTTGGGIANTGYLNMIMCHAYDSEEARSITGALLGILTGQSYFVSSLIARKVGAFEMYQINKEPMNRVIRNHARVAGALDTDFESLSYRPVVIDHTILKKEGMENLSNSLKSIWSNAVEYGETYGFRNAQTTVVAPTGTISFAMDCATTSIEPFFSHVVYKKLVGGGYLEIVNPAILLALRKLKYSEEEISDILSYILRKKKIDSYEIIEDGKIEGAPHLKPEYLSIFDTANKCGTGSRYIEPEGHVRMMAQLTPLVSGAISKTVNLPASATTEEIGYIHELAWRLGVKAIALYRDGCKVSQPLSSAISEEKERLVEDMTYSELVSEVKKLKNSTITSPAKILRKKPDSVIFARRHKAKLDGIKIFIHIGFDVDGNIVEIFTTADKEGSLIGGILDSLSIMMSNMLQHGIPAKEIIKSLKGQKYEPHGFVSEHPYIKSVSSLSDLISKVIEIELGDFSSCQVKPNVGTFFTQKEILNRIKGISLSVDANEVATTFVDNHKDLSQGQKVYGKTCSHCSSTNMIKNGTCYICADCGTTTGCS